MEVIEEYKRHKGNKASRQRSGTRNPKPETHGNANRKTVRQLADETAKPIFGTNNFFITFITRQRANSQKTELYSSLPLCLVASLPF
jgi:hypothetical protein